MTLDQRTAFWMNLIEAIRSWETNAPNQLPRQASWKPAPRVVMLHDNKRPPDALDGNFHSTTIGTSAIGTSAIGNSAIGTESV